MRKITDIYTEYKIPQKLQEHQLRVAAVAAQICEAVGEYPEDVLAAALIHDMGNVLKFDFVQAKEIFGFTDEEVLYFQNVQNEFKEKYGASEHEATVKIARELGLPEQVITLADQNRFGFLCLHRGADDFGIKILHYADSRVGPHGVLSYDDRMKDAGERYKNRQKSGMEEERKKLVACGRDIEEQIFSRTTIRPEDVTDQSIFPYIEKLKNFSL